MMEGVRKKGKTKRKVDDQLVVETTTKEIRDEEIVYVHRSCNQNPFFFCEGGGAKKCEEKRKNRGEKSIKKNPVTLEMPRIFHFC
jgi:hypothetical protein